MKSWRWFVALPVIAALICFEGAALGGSSAPEGRKPAQQTDELFTNGVVLHLSIEVAETNIAALREQPHTSVPAIVREGQTVYSNATVHLKGSKGSFRPVDQKPGFTLHFHSPEGPERFHGLKKFHLNNSVQDPSYLSEFISSGLFRDAGVPAPRAAHALVELNGRKLGLYVLLETIDKQFLSQYFRQPRGNVYGESTYRDVTDPIARTFGEGPLDWADLKALAAATQEVDPARRVERLQQTLDLDRFLSFMALEVMLDHWDGYTFRRHNFRLYQDLATSRVVFIPHDLDQVIRNPTVQVVPEVNGLVSQAILKTPELRRRYVARFGTLFTNIFVVPRLAERIDEAVARIRPALASFNENLARQAEDRANCLMGRFVTRAEYLTNHLDVPEPERLEFQDNIAKLKGWRPGPNQRSAVLSQVKEDTGKAALWIQANGKARASWLKQVTVAPGRYRFECMARCTGVARTIEGAGLRVSGIKQRRQNGLVGDSQWQKLTFEFDAPPEQEVELACELSSSQGEVWFDLGSLQLVRLR